jgi:hypothetical protein
MNDPFTQLILGDPKNNYGTIEVNFVLNDSLSKPNKLADGELRFIGGVMDGLKLIGFTIWQGRESGTYNVTFPNRSFTVNGERRSLALLRSTTGNLDAQYRFRDYILKAWEKFNYQPITTPYVSPIPKAVDDDDSDIPF